MGKTSTLVISLVALNVSMMLNVVIGTLLSISWPPREGELANYHEWSVLQSAQMRPSEAKTINGLKILKVDEYYALGIDNEQGITWMITNTESIPKIKIVGPDRRPKIRITKS